MAYTEPTLLETIHALDVEIDQTKAEMKTVKEAINAEIEETDIWHDLEDAVEKVKTLKLQLKAEVQGNSFLTGAYEELAELKFKLTDQREILSHHLIKYQKVHEDNQLPLADQSRAKRIIIKAKLSAKEEFYQEPMKFDGGRSYEI